MFTSSRSNSLVIVNRVASALIGGYTFTWGFASLGIALLTRLGVDFREAETAILILAFLVFVSVFMWAFACKGVGRVWLVLAGGGLVMTLSAVAIQQTMLS